MWASRREILLKWWCNQARQRAWHFGTSLSPTSIVCKCPIAAMQVALKMIPTFLSQCASLNASFCTPFNVLAPCATFDRTFLPGLLDNSFLCCSSAVDCPGVAEAGSLLQSHWSDYNIYSQNTVVRPVRLVPEIFANRLHSPSFGL